MATGPTSESTQGISIVISGHMMVYRDWEVTYRSVEIG